MNNREPEVIAFCAALKYEGVRAALESLYVDSKVDLMEMLSAPREPRKERVQ